MSQHGTFIQKLLKYALRAEKMAESALRANSTLCRKLNQSDRSQHFLPLNNLFVGVNIWICVLDYLNKTQDSRSFGAKPPCQDLMKNTNCKHNIKILEK